MTRRSAVASLATLAVAARQASATAVSSINDGIPETEVVEQQLPRGDKIDANNAIVVDYKALPGLYPTVAGKIASNGPYSSLEDLYSIPGLSKDAKALIKKYESKLTVLPPGRGFNERINQRQST